MEKLARGDHSLIKEPSEQAMLTYVGKLTRTPGAVEEGDVEALRSAGWQDDHILDIALITSYFNFVNRVADGLGVQLEPGHQSKLDLTHPR